jgi:uncharacterized protein (DUF1778 family)
MGKGTAENIKGEIVKLRMSMQDKRQLQNQAKEQGKSVSDFIRDKVAKD